jgi:hypothetical protein
MGNLMGVGRYLVVGIGRRLLIGIWGHGKGSPLGWGFMGTWGEGVPTDGE